MDRRLLTGLAALTLLDLSASSADAQDWSGPYFGAHLGPRSADARLVTGAYTLNNPIDLDPAIGPRSERYELSRTIFGVHSGYNFQFPGNWVLGVEASASGGSQSDTKTRTIMIDGVAYNLASAAELNWQATLRARAGFALGPVLLYGTGGLAWTEFNWNEVFSSPGAFRIATTKSDVIRGRVFGGGAELALSSNWILRVEYLCEDFGSIVVPMAAALPAGTAGNVDLEVRKVLFAVSYKF